MHIGNMVRAARKASGFTQAALAEAAGVSARALWNLEQNSGSMKTYHRVAKELDLRLAGLPSASDLGKRIRIARERKKWTQRDLADRAKITSATVRSIEENAGSVPSLSAILGVLAPRVRQRMAERAAWAEGGRDERFTPSHFLAKIEAAFGPISLDPAAHPSANVVAERYIAIKEDGLKTTWSGLLAFVNPPYSASAAWIERCARAWREGEVRTVVLLCPARVHTKAYRDHVHGIAGTIFVVGRIKFDNAPANRGGLPLGLMLCVWGASADELDRLRSEIPGEYIPGSSTCEVNAVRAGGRICELLE